MKPARNRTVDRTVDRTLHASPEQPQPARPAGRPPGVAARVLAAVVRGYQLVVSPWFAPRCRYYPTCSAYALGSLQVHGAAKGSVLALWRILRCNPWSKGGIDHIPEDGSWRGSNEIVVTPSAVTDSTE